MAGSPAARLMYQVLQTKATEVFVGVDLYKELRRSPDDAAQSSDAPSVHGCAILLDPNLPATEFRFPKSSVLDRLIGRLVGRH